MPERSFTRHVRRFFADTLIGLALFVVLAMVGAGSDTFAAGHHLAGHLLHKFEAAAGQVGAAAEGIGLSSPDLVALAVVFSVMFALNAAFLRHVLRLQAVRRRRRSLGGPR